MLNIHFAISLMYYSPINNNRMKLSLLSYGLASTLKTYVKRFLADFLALLKAILWRMCYCYFLFNHYKGVDITDLLVLSLCTLVLGVIL